MREIETMNTVVESRRKYVLTSIMLHSCILSRIPYGEAGDQVRAVDDMGVDVVDATIFWVKRFRDDPVEIPGFVNSLLGYTILQRVISLFAVELRLCKLHENVYTSSVSTFQKPREFEMIGTTIITMIGQLIEWVFLFIQGSINLSTVFMSSHSK